MRWGTPLFGTVVSFRWREFSSALTCLSIHRFSFASPTGTADGKRLAFLKANFQSDVYVAELEAGGTKLTTPRRLTLDERNDWPTAWTADSRAVLFWSNRNGSNQIFKQSIDQQTAETVVAGGPGDVWMPRVSPDGMSVLYLSSPQGIDNPSAVQLMRVQSRGGSPQLVTDVPRFGNFACTRPPSGVCIVAQLNEDGKKLVFGAFDPVQGKPFGA